MADVIIFGVTIFGAEKKRKSYIEERVAELLFRCGINEEDIQVDVFLLGKSKCCVRVLVDHDDFSLWLYGPDLERYVRQRMLSIYKIEITYLGFKRSDKFVFGHRRPLKGSDRIHQELLKAQRKFKLIGKLPELKNIEGPIDPSVISVEEYVH